MDPYKLGMLTGVIVALIGLVIIRKFNKNNHAAEYDERQKLLQGKAHKAGFFTAIILCAAYGFIGEFGAEFCSVGTAMFIIICLSIMVYAVLAIHYDAYVGFRANTKKQYTSLVILFGVMVLDSVMMVADHGLVEDGMLSVAALPITATIVYIVIFAAMFIHAQRAKKESEEE